MSEKKDEKELSEKHSLHYEQQKQLHSSLAVSEQEEAMQSFNEKRNLSSSFNEAVPSSELGGKLPSLSSDSSLLHPPPPAYCHDFQSLDASSMSKSNKQDANNVASMESSRCDYRNLLIKDLRFETRRQLGLRLDLEHAVVANWKSFADAIGFSNLEIQNFKNDRYKTQAVLNETEVRLPNLSVGDLCNILEGIDRQDIITDMERWFTTNYIPSVHSSNSFPSVASQLPGSNLPSSFISAGQQESAASLPGSLHHDAAQLLPRTWQPSTLPTNDSVQVPLITTTHRTATPASSLSDNGMPVCAADPASSKGSYGHSLPPTYSEVSAANTSLSSAGIAPSEVLLPPENYDAYLIYDEADKRFILDEFLPKIEGEAGAKLLIPGRDLSAGDNSYSAQLEAMLNRCPKLIVILSDEFLRSRNSRWELNLALALDPAARQRKIIPVIYKRITERSNVLAGICACDRTRVLEEGWFWDGLLRSLNRSR